MSTRNPLLSKSRLVSAWQCPKKLYLEIRRPDLAVITPEVEALFATGHRLGAIAQDLYGTPDSVEIPFNRKIQTMLQQTAALIDGGADFPIFEATFQYDGVLVRVDVLLPAGQGWHVIEVKASTSVKDHHVIDCAIQNWVMCRSGINIESISLAHIDNQFVYPGDKQYKGLLVTEDLTEQVRAREQDVAELITRARDAANGPMPEVSVGPQCTNPYNCQFQHYCWPNDTEYPIRGLGGSTAKLGQYVALGARDIRDVDANSIRAATQRRIHRVTMDGEPELLGDAREILEGLAYPRYYLDFETIAPAVPFWAGTRPYEMLPVQWSCHIDDGIAGADLRHDEFLDLSGTPPMRDLAERLLDCVGESGPILMYTGFEARVINTLAEMFPDLAEGLGKVSGRLFDLHPVVRDNFYHPKMLGSWSIKAVLPCIAPHLDYANLAGINDGTAASEGFIEAIDPETDWVRKAEIEEQLLRYCRLDTEAMVEIVRFFSGSEGSQA